MKYLLIIVKMPDICNMIGQNSVHTSDMFIFAVQTSMECKARKIEAGKSNSFGKQKILKNSKQSKSSIVITYIIIYLSF